MNLKQFEELLNQYDADELTTDIIYDICVKFKSLALSDRGNYTWETLNDRFGHFKATGENLRCWVKQKQYENGTIERNPKLLTNQNIDQLEFVDFEQKTQELKENLYKQQVKTRDTLNAYTKKIRDVARVESFRELMEECANKSEPIKLQKYRGDSSSDNEAVLLLSDLHIGLQVDKFCNKYNLDIAKERVAKLVHYTIKYCKEHKVKRLNVLLLGDLCSGIIHVNARLEQELNIVQQIISASEIVSQALGELQEAAPEVFVRSCTDNHSRAVANLAEHIESENYGKLIDFYLEEKLKNTKIQFMHDNLDQEIGAFELLNGETMVFTHGHHDNYNQVFQVYSGLLKKYVKYICLGHFHSKKEKSFMGAKVIVNGSICGVDQYAFSKRLMDDPEQALLIFEDNNFLDLTIGLK